MGFWSTLFSTKPDPDQKTRDLAALMASNGEKAFLTGLELAIGMADAGDERGISAMRLAMIDRSGKGTASFYEPGHILARADVVAARYMNARSRLLELASRGALLEDIYASGDLLSAELQNMQGSHSQLEALAYEVRNAGGIGQILAFQLLYNEQRCSNLLRARKVGDA